MSNIRSCCLRDSTWTRHSFTFRLQKELTIFLCVHKPANECHFQTSFNPQRRNYAIYLYLRVIGNIDLHVRCFMFTIVKLFLNKKIIINDSSNKNVDHDFYSIQANYRFMPMQNFLQQYSNGETKLIFIVILQSREEQNICCDSLGNI